MHVMIIAPFFKMERHGCIIHMKVVTAEWTRLGPDGEEEMSRYMNLHGFVRFGLISEYTTQDVVYVQDFLQGFRNWL